MPHDTLIGRSHPLLRRLRALRRDRGRRDAEGVFVAEGIHLVREALAGGAEIEAVVRTPRLDQTAEGRLLAARLAASVAAVRSVAEETMEGLQEARSPQPVLAIVRRPPVGLDAALDGRSSPALVVAVHDLQDPGNLGSLLRSADAAGATGFVVTGSGADLFHPKTVRATMGAIFRLPAAAADTEAFLGGLRKRNIRTVAADPRAAASYDDVDWSVPIAILLGSEGAGLPAELAGRLHVRVRIPMIEGAESLSVAAAGAVLAFEAARMRRAARR